MKATKIRIGNALLMAVLVMATLPSCGDDDEALGPGYISINGKKMIMTQARFSYAAEIYTNLDTGEEMYINSLTMLSSGLNINGDDVTGKGTAFEVEVITATQTLEAGRYVLSEDELE